MEQLDLQQRSMEAERSAGLFRVNSCEAKLQVRPLSDSLNGYYAATDKTSAKHLPRAPQKTSLATVIYKEV